MADVTLKEFLESKIDALTKQIDGINAVHEVSGRLLESRMDRMDLKITTIESKAAGKSESWSFFVAAGGMIIAALSGFALFLR